VKGLHQQFPVQMEPPDQTERKEVVCRADTVSHYADGVYAHGFVS
jgi:hypothetical protein